MAVRAVSKMCLGAKFFNADVTKWSTVEGARMSRMFEDADAWNVAYKRNDNNTDITDGPPKAWEAVHDRAKSAATNTWHPERVLARRSPYNRKDVSSTTFFTVVCVTTRSISTNPSYGVQCSQLRDQMHRFAPCTVGISNESRKTRKRIISRTGDSQIRSHVHGSAHIW